MVPVWEPLQTRAFLSRSFTYSTLNRLLSATNPESGQIDYGYDNAGNLVKRKMGAQLRCTGTISGSDCAADAYTGGYDDLNRIRVQKYNDSNTSQVEYSYDAADSANLPSGCLASGQQGPVGRLAKVSNGASTNFYYHDKLGNVACNREKTGTPSYDFTYTRTPQGVPTQMTYLSGRTVSAGIDAAGRLVTLAGAPQGGSSSYYLGDATSPILYTAHGGIAQVKLGNGLYETSEFNGRLQLADRKLGTTAGAYGVWRLQNGYAESQNSGNVVSQTETVPGWSTPITSQYRYDLLNRLVLASEKPSSATTPVCPDAGSRWCQTYSYDALGNRAVSQRDNLGVPVNDPQAFVNNQVAGTDWHYDARGNLDTNPGVGGAKTFLYDGENRQIAYCPQDTNPANCVFAAGSDRTLYSYDGEGRRVSQSNASGTIVFAYDAAGQLAAEYGGTVETAGRTYLTSDHLGSTRVVTDTLQNVVTRRDYVPFGEELQADSRNGRLGIAGYSTDGGVKIKFTAKERDAETGLDYFGARYFSGAQGRFTGPDPLLNSGRPDDPQFWNRYAYVNNNPLRYRDPLGLYRWATNCDEANDSACKTQRDQFRTAHANLKQAAANLQEGSKERKQLDKIVKRIGEEGKGPVQIAFGDAGRDANGNPNAGSAVGNKITLNLDAVSQLASSWGTSLGYNEGQAAALSSNIMTGLVGHEGGHLAGTGIPGLSFMMRTERTALYSESATYQGLQYTDLLYKLWNESWAKVDVATREEFRNQAIQTELNRQRGKEPPK